MLPEARGWTSWHYPASPAHTHLDSLWGWPSCMTNPCPPPQIRLMKGPKPFEDSMAFDGIHIVSHLAVDDDSLHSSDEELLASPMGVGALQDVLYPLSPRNTRFLRGAGSSGKESSTDSEPEEPATAPGLQPPLLFGEALGK